MKVRFSKSAKRELFQIWLYNANRRGVRQVDEYETYLGEHILSLENDHTVGNPVKGFPELGNS